MDATLKTIQATLTMSTNEGAKHGDDDEHIHENAHQVIIHFFKGIGILLPTSNKAFFCLLKHKVEPKGQDQSEREKKRTFTEL
jgi:hypothetical protein